MYQQLPYDPDMEGKPVTDVSTSPVRTIDGLELPASGRWVLDPSHTTIGFVAKHLMVAKVRGAFKSFSGGVTVAERIEDSTADARIDASSVDTGDEGRDEHLRTNDFFGVEENPQITFASTQITPTGKGRWDVAGDLTIRGVTRSVVLQATYEGLFTDPWGTPHAVVSASTTVDREDFGLTWNQALEAGGVLVSNQIKLSLEVQAVKAG
jgi:polyisoprenoid-binding protein YceI